MLIDGIRSLTASIGGIDSGGFWLPRQGSTVAPRVDGLFMAITWISIFFFVLITVALMYFVWKYRARPGHEAEPSETHNRTLEVTWTVIPLLIVIWIFWEGFTGLAVTVLSILTLFLLMQLTGKVRWGAPAALPPPEA